jgi:hypothetical protein
MLNSIWNLQFAASLSKAVAILRCGIDGDGKDLSGLDQFLGCQDTKMAW